MPWQNTNLDGVRFFVNAVPEPGLFALFTTGAAMATVRIRRQRQAKLIRLLW